MLYAVEINEPYQANVEYKFRVFMLVHDDGGFAWTNKPAKAFVTDDEEFAKALAETLAPSWDAQVVPAEEGTEHPLSKPELLKVFKERGRVRLQQARQIR